VSALIFVTSPDRRLISTVSPTMTRMNRAHTYPPVGKCIYCGSDGGAGRLDREHIIAKSLGGMLVLPGASCIECAKATSAVERQIARELFRAIRRQMGLSMKPRSRLRGFEVGLDGADASVLAEGYPGSAHLLCLSAAGHPGQVPRPSRSLGVASLWPRCPISERG
jgi:hypothetical protein